MIWRYSSSATVACSCGHRPDSSGRYEPPVAAGSGRRRERMRPCGSSPAPGRSSPAPRAGSAAPCAGARDRAGRAGAGGPRQERSEELVERLPASPAGPHLALAADVADRGQLQRAVDRFVEAGRRPRAARRQRRHRPLRRRSPTPRSSEPRRWCGSTCSARSTRSRRRSRTCSTAPAATSSSSPRAPACAPFPWGAVYGATKAADRGFAEALRHELSGTGVSVTTVFPGEIETDLHAHQRDRLPDWRGRRERAAAERVAEAIVEAVEDDRRAVYVPGAGPAARAQRVAPRLTDGLLRRIRGATAAPRGATSGARPGSRPPPRRSRRPCGPR